MGRRAIDADLVDLKTVTGSKLDQLGQSPVAYVHAELQ